MILHLHLGNQPITVSIIKGEGPQRELEDLREALLHYAMRLPVEGARARFVLRRWAGAGGAR